MTRRISAEMHRNDLTATSSLIKDAIISAIGYWEDRRFTFNEFRDENIVTTSGDAFLSSMPAGIIYLDSLKMTIGSRDYPLTPKSYAWMDYVDSGQWTGFPENYAWYQKGSATATASFQTLRLYPIPNGAYTVKMSYLKRLSEVTAGAGSAVTNAWMTAGERIVRMQTKGYLFDHHLRSPPNADRQYQLADKEYKEMLSEINFRTGSGLLRPTSF